MKPACQFPISHVPNLPQYASRNLKIYNTNIVNTQANRKYPNHHASNSSQSYNHRHWVKHSSNQAATLDTQLNCNRAGIIGLTSALKIQQLVSDGSIDVLVVAREWPTSIPGAPIQHSADYASMWAGAHVRPIPASTPQLRREARWLKQTVAEFKRHLETDPSAGISQVAGVEYLGTSPPEYERQDTESFAGESGLLGYRRYPTHELPEGISLGFEYQTYCVNSPLYCGNLLRKFILQGGRTLHQDLKSPWEPYSWGPHIKTVVNSSGVGFGDPKCYPIRGLSSLYSSTVTSSIHSPRDC